MTLICFLRGRLSCNHNFSDFWGDNEELNIYLTKLHKTLNGRCMLFEKRTKRFRCMQLNRETKFYYLDNYLDYVKTTTKFFLQFL